MFISRFAFACLVLLTAAAARAELTVATYDSIFEQGLAKRIAAAFEKKCGCKVRIFSAGDAGRLVARMQLDAERGKHSFQIAFGLDAFAFERARPWVEPFKGRKIARLERTLPEVRLGDGFVPFDYGVLAWMADTEALAKDKVAVPARFSDLLNPRYSRRLLLPDPRTSSPGLGFLMSTRELGDFAGFWPAFRPQILTMPSGWSGAYSLFLKGEAPLVLSYTTSQAYHAEHGDRSGRYRAIMFEDGNPVHVEGAVVVRGSVGDAILRKQAFDFVEFLLSDEVQRMIPQGNWMLPAVRGTKLPPSFEKLPRPVRLLKVEADADGVRRALDEWNRLMSGGR